MDPTQLLKGVLDLAVLAVLAGEDGYGYDVVRRLREAGLEDVGDASVYGTLRRLFLHGKLTSYVVPSDEGPHRKYYGINARLLPGWPLGIPTPSDYAHFDRVPSGATVAVSVSFLQTDLFKFSPMSTKSAAEFMGRLRRLEPIDNIGHSILIYRMP